MANSINIAELLGKVHEYGFLPTIRRYQYLPFKMEIAMNVVEALGKSRNPNFRIDDENRFTYENIIRWVHGDSSMECLHPVTKQRIQGDLHKGIYIAGNTGTGKSWCLDIMTAYCLVDNPQITFGRNTMGLRWKNVRTDVICDGFTTAGEIQQYKTMPIIGFQDLGTEPEESVYMGNRVQPMRAILEFRGDCTDKMTLITSNIPFAHERFVQRYGERCASRLNEMCNYFEITGKDRRKL